MADHALAEPCGPGYLRDRQADVDQFQRLGEHVAVGRPLVRVERFGHQACTCRVVVMGQPQLAHLLGSRTGAPPEFQPPPRPSWHAIRHEPHLAIPVNPRRGQRSCHPLSLSETGVVEVEASVHVQAGPADTPLVVRFPRGAMGRSIHGSKWCRYAGSMPWGEGPSDPHERVRWSYERFAQGQARGRSVLYEEIAARVAGDPELVDFLAGLRARSASRTCFSPPCRLLVVGPAAGTRSGLPSSDGARRSRLRGSGLCLSGGGHRQSPLLSGRTGQ